MDFKGDATPLRDGGVETVAGYLGCEVDVLRAVCDTWPGHVFPAIKRAVLPVSGGLHLT